MGNAECMVPDPRDKYAGTFLEVYKIKELHFLR